MSEERFSRRFGHGPEEREIAIRDDAPDEVRGAILKIAEGDLSLRPSYLRDVLCTVLRQLPARSNWSEYPNVWEECQRLIEGCAWYRVYDFVEELYRSLADDLEKATRWQDLINEYFLEAGVGWRMINGLLESRGPESFAASVDAARDTLARAGLPTARQEIHEALRDLSRRPAPDLTGAIHHAMAALECTAREATGDARTTLGEVLKRYPDLVPRPLDEALTKIWGYASEMARHLHLSCRKDRRWAATCLTSGRLTSQSRRPLARIRSPRLLTASVRPSEQGCEYSLMQTVDTFTHRER